ncbi:MAG: hypothetical protein ABL927_01095 [Bdellovibrionales bacterium]
MTNEHFLKSTISRLNEIMRRQYGSDFKFQTTAEIEGQDDSKSILQNLSSGLPFIFGKLVMLPIFTDKLLVGAGSLMHNNNFSTLDIRHVHQMVRLILEDAIMSHDKIETLDGVESLLRNSLDEATTPQRSNVIPINRFKKNTFPLTKINPLESCGTRISETESIASVTPLNTPLNFPFLIESRDPSDIFKMALEIHTHTKRFVFLSINDISPDAFVSSQSIVALGATTIFVPDVELLTPTQQTAIINYYNSAREKETPQFVVGALNPITQLVFESKLDTALLAVLRIGYLQMNQPFSFYKNQNILEFFYESLTGRLSI